MALGRGNIEIDIRGNVDTAGIARQVSAAEKKIRPLNVSLNEKGFTQPLGKISGDLAEFQKSLDASVARTLAFGAAVGVINSVSDAFKGLINSAKDVEKALTDVNVILNLNGNALQKFSNELFSVAANTGQSFQVVSEAAVELSRQGLGAQETLKRINDAMILTRLSGMEAAKSVETLTAAVNSFGSTALTTTDLVNKLATVDAAFAVSTEDLANGLARAGSTAQAAKVDLNELLAAITSVQQTTARGGAVIGNAFKSIFTRIQRSGVREALEGIGVATTDAAGNIRGALDILQDYAQVYKTLSDSQQAYTDELIAGVFQINNLKALIKDLGSDYSIYQRALGQSNNATDEAIRRNEQLQNTLSALINEASVNAKELAASLGSLVATPAVENLLNIFNSIAGALKQALDPEEGSKLIKGVFSTIGNFISGPGLIIIAAGFIKLFKFITGQSVKAIGEIFKIGQAKDKIADAEAKIGFLLKNNQSLYQAISNEALSHEQKEEMVLQTIKQQNRAYQEQQALISRIASSSGIRSALATPKVGTRATGYIPNFANGVAGAIKAEEEAVSSGVGGASKTAKPKVLKNFPMGGGKKQTIVANTDEVVVPRFGGGTGSAIFNKNMIDKFGMPDGAIPVSRGYIPSFAKSKLESDKQFQNVLSDFRGVSIDVQRDMSGFGMLSAKGARGNLDITKKPGFTREQKLEIINAIGGSSLNKNDKNYLLTTIGDKKKTRFSNIPAQTIQSADAKDIKGKVGALNNLINPYIADAVASVATNVYTKVLGDEVSAQNLVKNVRASANADQGIISVGAQGDIFESAIRLGSKESAKGLARDDRSAIWDFEESKSISPDLKSLFFPTSNIIKADAKRSGDQDSAGEVVKKAYKNTFDEQLKSLYARSWAPIVNAAVKASPSKSKTTRARTGVNLAGGYIPNFAKEEDKWVKTFQEIKRLASKKSYPLEDFFQDPELLYSELKNKPPISGTSFNMRASFSNIVRRPSKAVKMALGKTNTSAKEILKYYKDLTLYNHWKNINHEVEGLKGKKAFDSRIALAKYLGLTDHKLSAPSLKTKTISEAGINKEKFKANIVSLIKEDAQIIQSKIRGRNFESFVAELGGQKFIEGKDALDFAKSKNRGLNISSEIRKDINMRNNTRFGDAESGSGHTKEVMTSKVIRELSDLGLLKSISKDRSINLNKGGNLFYDVVANGSDKVVKVSKKFKDIYNRAKPETKKVLNNNFKRNGKIDAQTLNKQVNLQYIVDDINPERLKTKKNSKLGKKLKKYLEVAKAGGYVPNFFNEALEQRTGGKKKNKRRLDMSYFFPMASKGASALKAVYKDILGSAKAGRPYTNLDAGVVIGPRVPKLLFEGHRLLEQSRARGVNIPKMKIDGYLSPAMLMQKITELGRQESEGIKQSPMDYKSGEEKEVESYLRKLGLNPESMKNADIGNLPIFSRGFAGGFIPNFANELQEAIVREEKALKSQGSSAGVYVDQDNRLKDSKNPIGLLVANKRDEPGGGFQGINRAMSMGMDPKKHGMASGYIPNYIAGASMQKTNFDANSFKQLAKNTQQAANQAKIGADKIRELGGAAEDAGDESKSSMGRLIAFQIALGSIESVLTQTGMVAEDFSLQFSQAGFAVAELGEDLVGNLAKKMEESGGAIGKLGGKLGAFGKILGPLAVAGGLAKDIYDNFIDTNKKAIRSLDKEITSRNAASNTLSQNIEKIDQFAQVATKFGESLKGGKDAETTAKFLQEIFKTGRDVASLDPSAFSAIVNSLGDTEEFNKAVDNFKKVASAGKDVNQFGTDILKLSKTFRENDSDIGFDELQEKAGLTFENIAKGLTQNLSEEKIAQLANELKKFDSSSGNSSEKLQSLQSVFGTLDQAVVSAINNQEGLSGQIIEQIKQQSIYAQAMNKASQAMAKTRAPVEQLNAKLNELAQGMLLAAQNSKAAIDVLSQTGQIQAKSDLETLQATSTVSQKDLLSGQAAADIKSGITSAAADQRNALNEFAAKLIQESKDGTTTLSSEMQSLIASISSGGASPEEAIKALINIQKTGNPEEKKTALATINELRKINQTQLKNAAITNANLQAQLRAVDAQAIAFQRNNQLSGSQLQNLGSINNLFQSNSTLLKSQLEKLGEVKSAIDLIEDLGGSSDIIAALREENKQETQFENLQSAFEQLSGTTSKALNLDELNEEIFKFDLSKVENETAALIMALNEAVDKAADPESEGGIASKEDVEEISTIAFADNELDELSTKMGEAVSNALASSLGIGPEIAGEINKSIDTQNIAAIIEKTAAQNLINQDKNAQINKEIFDSFAGSIQQIDFSKIDNSSTNLENASKALNSAAEKLLSTGTGGAASGFVPNFAPVQPIERALNTERAMGAKRPVVDNHPSIGTYVRDAVTQPNFSAVRRDHPEGIKQAIANSKNAQGTQARGFVPNFIGVEDITTGSTVGDTAAGSAITKAAAKGWEKIKSMPKSELAEKTKANAGRVLKGGWPALAGKLFSEATQYILGDISTPSSVKLIESIYYGSTKGKDVPPFVDQGQLKSALDPLNKDRITNIADQRIPSNESYSPQNLDKKAFELSKQLFDPYKESLFNLSRSNIKGLRGWGYKHARNDATSKFLKSFSNYATTAGDWIGTGSTVALALSPATGPLAPITATIGLVGSAGAGLSYVLGSASDMLNYYLDTGITTDQISKISESSLTPQLEQAMPLLFKKKVPNPDLFPVNDQDAAAQALKSETTQGSALKAIEEISNHKYFTLDANEFLNGNSGRPRLKVNSTQSQADFKLSNVGKDYQEAFQKKSFYTFSKKLVEQQISGSANFFANLSKAKGFEDVLSQDFQLKLPFSFESTKIGSSPTLWNSEALRKASESINAKISSQKQEKIALEESIKNLEAETNTDPNKKVLAQDVRKQLEFLNLSIRNNEIAYKKSRDLSNRFEVSKDIFNKEKGSYDRLDGSILRFPSPINEEFLKLKIPEAPVIGNQDAPKDFSINGYTKLSEGVVAAEAAISKQKDKSAKKVKELLSLDFSQFLQNATMLRPEGAIKGIDSATTFLEQQKVDRSFLGIKLGKKSAFEEEISKIKQEKKVIEQFNKGEKIEDQETLISVIGQDGAEINQKINQEKASTEEQKIRDALYLQILGKRAEGFMGEGSILEARSRIERIESGKQSLQSQLDSVIKERQRRIGIIQSRNPRPGDEKTLSQFEAEIKIAKERQQLYSSAEGTGFLFFTKGMPAEINGQRMPSPIWQSDPDYNSKFEDIQKIIKQQDVGPEGLGLGKFVGNTENIDLFAMMRYQPSNAGKEGLGAEFEKNFAAANVDQRRAVLEKLGLVTKKLNQNELEGLLSGDVADQPGVSQVITNIRKNLQSISGKDSKDPFGFLVDEIIYHSKDVQQKAMFVKALQRFDIPFSPTSNVLDYLKNKKVDIEHQMSPNEKFSVPALEPVDIAATRRFVTKFQIDQFAEKAGKAIQEGGLTEQINTLLNQESINRLTSSPVYLYDQQEKLNDIAKESSEKIPNFELWKQKYGSGVLTKFGITEYGSLDGILGNYSQDVSDKHEEYLGKGQLVSDQDAIRQVMGVIDHAKNTEIENLLANSTYPFEGINVDNWDQRYQAAVKSISEYYKQVKTSYAPFGYTQSIHSAETPSGLPEQVDNLLKTMFPTTSVGKQDNQARGFVPNFSAIAGEIAASKTAGYKTPVTPSQVKSMNIPGVGRTSYNTQESVFKLPGMSQPFITPPSNSKAASSYAKTVQKKFNFNPYTKAADGFVPNFAPNQNTAALDSLIVSFSSIAESFSTSTTAFREAVSNLNFQGLNDASDKILQSSQASENQSNALKEAAGLIQQGANTLTEGQGNQIDFSALTSAASSIQSSFDALSSQLNQPMQIDSSAIEDSMSALTSALQNINGTVAVDIPDVNVNVNGTQGIANSVRAIIETEVPKLVAAEISNLNIGDQIGNYLR